MTDRRSYDIKKKLKMHYPDAKFSVRIDKYSMGESINIHTNGDILGGGNTYLFIEAMA